MAETEKKKASVLSRLASTFAFVYLLCVLLSFAAGIAGLSSALAVVVAILSVFIAPPAGIAALVLGIIALCRLTPEEKSESAWRSGTTKNNALVGIILPPAIFVLMTVLNAIAFSMMSKQ
jgi:ABC-type proline/glycine betaine transport system permease subunit